MAARTRRPYHNELAREKIKTTQLMKRLMYHALGQKDPAEVAKALKEGRKESDVKPVEMTPSQINAATTLLRKTIPDLSAVDMNVKGKLEAQIVDLVRSLGESASRDESAEETMH